MLNLKDKGQPQIVLLETLLHVVENAKSDADAAAEKAAIAEAESAFVPDAGKSEIRIKSKFATQAAHAACVVEKMADNVIAAEQRL